MASKLHLKIAVAEYPHTSAVRSGSIPIEGVDAEFITVKPQIGAFRRMVRDVEFDVCELAPTTYYIARAYGAPFKALPIFVMRRFHHSGLLVRPDAHIHHPKNLEGKKVGVRAYSVTTGAWTRAIFIKEFGMDNDKVTWVVDDEEHVTQMKLPSNVIRTPPDDSLYDMIMRGELVAGFAANAGIGRKGSPTGGWQEVDVDFPDLFPNAAELEAEWFGRTGVYPMHGTIVVKDSVLIEHPWVARSLYEAFDRAKSEWLMGLDNRIAAGKLLPGDKKASEVAKITGDPFPNGLQANLPTIKYLEEAAFAMNLTPRRMSVEELFVNTDKL